jgi:hypothetical protein
LLLPHLLALTLVVKPVHLGDLPRFVVPSNERCSFGIPDLQGAQQEECLDRMKPPINEIAFSEKVWDERTFFLGMTALTAWEEDGLGTALFTLINK